jgi:hypothetical protein
VGITSLTGGREGEAGDEVGGRTRGGIVSDKVSSPCWMMN